MTETTLVVGERLPDGAFAALTDGHVLAYAEASGDHNPIHLDKSAAQAVGLDGPIVHGMLAMGQFEAALRSWRPDLRIRSLQTRFMKPLPVGTPVAVQGRVAKVTNTGGIVRLMVQDADGATYCLGDATVDIG